MSGIGTSINITVIPNFVSARTLRGLRRAILKNNTQKGKYFHYYNIMKDGTKWYAFYEEELNLQARNGQDFKDLMGGTQNPKELESVEVDE